MLEWKIFDYTMASSKTNTTKKLIFLSTEQSQYEICCATLNKFK